MTWNDQFLTLFRTCVEHYRSGNNDFHSYYEPDDISFLASIGYKPRELFDFVEDLVDAGSPSESTALLIATARRDYFLTVQDGQHSDLEITANDIPARDESLDGNPYFPRILAKARAKLHGELHPDLMFCCGGDRAFFNQHGNIHPADFLRHVWASGNEDTHIVEFLRKSVSQA